MTHVWGCSLITINMKCNWCGSSLVNSLSNHYCDDCSIHCKRECKTCHKPYPSVKKYFKAVEDERCRSCQNRHEKCKSAQKSDVRAVNDDQAAPAVAAVEEEDDEDDTGYISSEDDDEDEYESEEIGEKDGLSSAADQKDRLPPSPVTPEAEAEQPPMMGIGGSGKPKDDKDKDSVALTAPLFPPPAKRAKRKSGEKKAQKSIMEILNVAKANKSKSGLTAATAAGAADDTVKKPKRKYTKRSEPTDAVGQARAQESLLRAMLDYQKAVPKKGQVTIVYL